MIAERRPADPLLVRLPRLALIVGAVGLLLWVIGGVFDPTQAFRSYLMAYAFWIQLPLGCLALSLIQFLTGGLWGLALRRIAEAGARTLPLLALLFLPILFAIPLLYVWAQPAIVAQDPLLQHKSSYLNQPGYAVRAVIYFAIWCGLAYYLNRWSTEQDRTTAPELLGKLQRLATVGVILLGTSASFAAIDWLMSLEPHWYSTMYGAVVAWGAVLTAMAFSMLVLILLGQRQPLAAVLSPRVLNDLGTLLLAFLILWAYMAYFQYLIIWAGNVTEEIEWFVRRLESGWLWIGVFVVVVAFSIPFFLLLFRDLKRNPRTLAVITGIVLFSRPFLTLWLVSPAFGVEGWLVHWQDLAALIGLGGLWLAVYTWQLSRQPLLPPNDPRLPAMLESAHGSA